ncbi:hypothetical protein RhiirB3_492085 [Rhizophagus irregularis]|nr:hypothetical protein RhiirB3_492085 [Rhizophagus irregularis]
MGINVEPTGNRNGTERTVPIPTHQVDSCTGQLWQGGQRGCCSSSACSGTLEMDIVSQRSCNRRKVIIADVKVKTPAREMLKNLTQVTSFTKSMAQVSELHNITINAVTIVNKVSMMSAGAVGVPDHCSISTELVLTNDRLLLHAVLLPMDKPCGGGYTFGAPTQCAVYMAPRPGYGIPWGGISPMAAPDSEWANECYISILVNKLTMIFQYFNEQYIIKLDLMNLGALEEGKTCSTLKSWKRVKDQSGNPKGFGFAEYALICLSGDCKDLWYIKILETS